MKKPKVKTMMTCLREVYEANGFGGLFQGLGAKLTQTVLNAAFMFAFYETIMRYTRSTFKALNL